MKSAICSIFLLAGLAGCGRGHKGVEGATDRLPEPFTLEFRAFEKGRRHVLYQLGADGSLRYGGGRDASGGTAPRDAGVVTEAERMELWRVIHRHNLLVARGDLFPDDGRVRYKLEVRAGWKRNSFSAAGGDIPGLKQLDELLFNLQARNRFEEQTEGVLPPAQPPAK